MTKRKNRNNKSLSNTGSRNRNNTDTGAIKLDSNRTQFKQKAFGGKEITKIFKEQDVLRDASGKFIDKPGQGEPPKYKALDKAKKNIKANTKNDTGEVKNPQYKQMQQVKKRVDKRRKAVDKLEELKEGKRQFQQIESQEAKAQKLNEYLAAKVQLESESKSKRKNVLDYLDDFEDEKVKSRTLLSQIEVPQSADTEINGLINSAFNGTTRAMTFDETLSRVQESVLAAMAKASGRTLEQMRRVMNPEDYAIDIQATADKIREKLKEDIKRANEERRKNEPQPEPEPPVTSPAPEPKKPKAKSGKSSIEEPSYTTETINKAPKITDSSTKARKSTPKSEDKVQERLKDITEVLGEDTVAILAQYFDLASFSPKDFNRLQNDLLLRAYTEAKKSGLINYADGEEINWNNLAAQLDESQLQSIIGRWAGSKPVSKFTRVNKWRNKRAKQSKNTYATPDETQNKRDKAKEKKEKGNYSYRNDGKEVEGKIKNSMVQGMNQTIFQVINKATTAVVNSMRRKGNEPTQEEIDAITKRVGQETIDKAFKVADYLNEQNGAVENFQGRTVVNPASPYPNELIEFTPSVALAYIRLRMLNEIANDSDSSVSYVELLHGDSETNISEPRSKKFVYELHHIEQFMYRHPDGQPVLVYDGEKDNGSVRGMIHSDFNNLRAEETPNGRRYYIQDGDGKKSYLARSPFDDETNVTIGKNNRVQQDGEDSISPIRREIGTDEAYIDLRGASHRNKEYVYSLIHPLTSIENSDGLREQLNNLSAVNAENGQQPVSQRYIDGEFISAGVGEKERVAHDKFRRDLMVTRRLEVVERIEAEMATRNPQEAAGAEILGTQGYLSEVVGRETNNAKTTTNVYNELVRLQASYKAIGISPDKLKELDKQVTTAKNDMDKANQRLKESTKELDTHFDANREYIGKNFDAKAQTLASDGFLKGKILDPEVWEVDEGGNNAIELRNRILSKSSSFDVQSDVGLNI